MTHWQYFANDKIFLKTVSPLLNYLEHQVDLHPYILCEAWGLIEGLHEYTKNMIMLQIYFLVLCI